MKRVVALQDLLELEIRPGPLLAEYQALAEAAVRTWPAAALREVACPACSGSGEAAFERFGLAYRECAACGSVYLSPRPGEDVLAEHVRSSPAARFWRERIAPATGEARSGKLALPRADWVRDAIAEYRPGAAVGLDLGPHGDALVRELAGAPLTRVIAAHAAADLEVQAGSGVEVQPGALERAEGSVDVITAFETIDRAADLPSLVARMRRALRPGGLLFVTAPNMSGFELQALWDRAPSIVPPDKMNLLTVQGFLTRFAEGWEILELSTPGMFDVDAVRRAVDADPGAPWPRIVRSLVTLPDARARTEFQEYLQRARLASAARLLARRTA